MYRNLKCIWNSFFFLWRFQFCDFFSPFPYLSFEASITNIDVLLHLLPQNNFSWHIKQFSAFKTMPSKVFSGCAKQKQMKQAAGKLLIGRKMLPQPPNEFIEWKMLQEKSSRSSGQSESETQTAASNPLTWYLLFHTHTHTLCRSESVFPFAPALFQKAHFLLLFFWLVFGAGVGETRYFYV